jgi:hypothetical protein
VFDCPQGLTLTTKSEYWDLFSTFGSASCLFFYHFDFCVYKVSWGFDVEHRRAGFHERPLQEAAV